MRSPGLSAECRRMPLSAPVFVSKTEQNASFSLYLWPRVYISLVMDDIQDGDNMAESKRQSRLNWTGPLIVSVRGYKRGKHNGEIFTLKLAINTRNTRQILSTPLFPPFSKTGDHKCANDRNCNRAKDNRGDPRGDCIEVIEPHPKHQRSKRAYTREDQY